MQVSLSFSLFYLKWIRNAIQMKRPTDFSSFRAILIEWIINKQKRCTCFVSHQRNYHFIFFAAVGGVHIKYNERKSAHITLYQKQINDKQNNNNKISKWNGNGNCIPFNGNFVIYFIFSFFVSPHSLPTVIPSSFDSTDLPGQLVYWAVSDKN